MSYLKMSKKKSKKKKIIYLLWIAIIVILLVVFSKINIPGISTVSGKITGGIGNIFSTIKGVTSNGFEYFGSIKKLNQRNKELEKEIDELNYKLLEIDTIEADNRNLRDKLEIKERYNHFKLVYADIIVKNYDNFNETFVINKGEKDGIKLKQTVITKDGLLGHISSVSDETAVVVTILDPNVSVGVEMASVNKNALVKGDFALKNEAKLKLTYIPIDTEVSVSEVVYTSGIGEVYPKGIPVGTIEKVFNKKNDIDRYAIIKPLADINNVKSVGIIVN